jgi:hypothetical protein
LAVKPVVETPGLNPEAHGQEGNSPTEIMIHPGLNVKPSGREMIGIILMMNKMNQWKRLPAQGKLSISRRKNPVSGVKVRMTVGLYLRMKIGPDFQMTVGPDIQTTAGPDLQMTAGPDLQMTAVPDLRMTAVPDLRMTAGPDIQTTAGPDLGMTVGQDLRMTAGPEQDQVVKKEHLKRNLRPNLQMIFLILLTSSSVEKSHQVLIRKSLIVVHVIAVLQIDIHALINKTSLQGAVVDQAVIKEQNSVAQRVGEPDEKADRRNYHFIRFDI